jgi:hypothetical protein
MDTNICGIVCHSLCSTVCLQMLLRN